MPYKKKKWKEMATVFANSPSRQNILLTLIFTFNVRIFILYLYHFFFTNDCLEGEPVFCVYNLISRMQEGPAGGS